MSQLSRRNFLSAVSSALSFHLIGSLFSAKAEAAQWKKIQAGISAATPRIFTWGENACGQLGQGTTSACNPTPTPIFGLDSAIAVATSYHSLVLMDDGTVKSWGNNSCGQLGNNTTSSTCIPVAVCGLSDAVAISSGSEHSLAVLRNGCIMAWGHNGDGRLGDNTTTTRRTPVVVCGITNAVMVTATENASYALLADGTVRSWGSGGNGRLGNNSTSSRSTPGAVCGINNAVSIAATGAGTAFAVLANGTIQSWGNDTFGLLGRSTCDSHQSTPVTVCGITNAKDISAGYLHVIALLHNGTLQAWGGNGNYRLGDNTSTDRSSPVAVCNISNAVAIGNGIDSGFALLQSGVIQTWGRNDYGYIGDTTTTDRRTAVVACTLVSYSSVARARNFRKISILSRGAFASSLMFIYRG